MTTHYAVQWLCSLGGVVIALIARDRLRMNPPRVRVALGAAGAFLAVLLYISMLRLLPRPLESGFRLKPIMWH